MAHPSREMVRPHWAHSPTNTTGASGRERQTIECMESAMTDVAFHLSSPASHHGRIALGMRRLLDELPDAVLKDSGLTRSDIPFVVARLMSKRRNAAREALDRFDWNAVWRNATILRLPETLLRLSLVATAIASAVFLLSSSILA